MASVHVFLGCKLEYPIIHLMNNHISTSLTVEQWLLRTFKGILEKNKNRILVHVTVTVGFRSW